MNSAQGEAGNYFLKSEALCLFCVCEQSHHGKSNGNGTQTDAQVVETNAQEEDRHRPSTDGPGVLFHYLGDTLLLLVIKPTQIRPYVFNTVFCP